MLLINPKISNTEIKIPLQMTLHFLELSGRSKFFIFIKLKRPEYDEINKKFSGTTK